MAVDHRHDRSRIERLLMAAVLLSGMIGSAAAFDATKRYQILPFEGRDLICEEYAFAAEEDPLSVFQQKGEISQADFVRFLRILQAINPGMSNPLRPKPGERVLLPLRFESLERSTGEARPLDVPMLSIPDANAGMSNSLSPTPFRLEHVVQPGENLFRIVLRYFGATDWKRRVERVLQLNPRIGTVNRLKAGDRIVLDVSDRTSPAQLAASAQQTAANGLLTLLQEAASRLKARLLTSGDVFFPKDDGGDVRLDLGGYPLLEMQPHRRVLIDPKGDLQDDTVRWIQRHWSNTTVMVVPSQVTDADGMVQAITRVMELPDAQAVAASMGRSASERKPALDALVFGRLWTMEGGHPQQAIERLLEAIGLRMQHAVQLQFPYGGVQIPTVCDLVELPSGKPLVIDVGNFGGEAAAALMGCGFGVFELSQDEDVRNALRRLMEVLARLEPKQYRLDAFTEPGLEATDILRFDWVQKGRSILLALQAVHPDRIEQWLRDGLDVIEFTSDV